MYTNYFGFDVSPFSVTPDPNFFYPSLVYREAFANLQYGIEAKKGFIVITGEVGTGKTTLLRKLMKHHVNGKVRSVFVFNTYLNFTELLQAILYDLGIPKPSANKAELLHELNSYLLAQLQENNIVAVLVDEAQNLSDEALEGLRLLSNMETDQEKLIQIVLMGQPELQTKLDQPALRQLKQRIALQCRLLALKPEEVRDYITLRLRVAGYNGKDLFQPDAIRQIAFYSNGIPRVINIICDNALLSAFAAHQKSVSAYIVEEVAADLRLGSASETAKSENVPFFGFSDEHEPSIGNTRTQGWRYSFRRAASVCFGVSLVVLAFLAVASLIDPRSLLAITGRGVLVAKHNLNQWALFLTDQKPATEKPRVELNTERKEQRIRVPRGSSIYKIANDTYGTNSSLGIDLIQEANSDIKNLNRISAGQALILPALTPDTLLRKQSDGSYHLIVASFRSLTAANDYSAALIQRGYQVASTARRISEDLLLYRVAITGLRSAEQAAELGLMDIRNDGLVYADN